jgi:hypothetical protein
MYYELATLTLWLGTVAQAVPAIDEYVHAADARGQLLGCWVAEIGELNRVVVLRGFAQEADLRAERQRGLFSANPFGCADHLTEFAMESYAGFPCLPPVQPGKFGPVYEIRTYVPKTGGLQPTLDAWQAALPARAALSPCTVAMYALDGTPRFTHIWPFASLDARAAIRADAVKQGVWPPKGGPAWLTTDMRSTIVLPTAISPLA